MHLPHPELRERPTLTTEPLANGLSAEVPPESIVTCTIVNEAMPDPGVAPEESIDGADANELPGPFFPVSEEVTSSYL